MKKRKRARTAGLPLLTEFNVFDVFCRWGHFTSCMHRVVAGPSRHGYCDRVQKRFLANLIGNIVIFISNVDKSELSATNPCGMQKRLLPDNVESPCAPVPSRNG